MARRREKFRSFISSPSRELIMIRVCLPPTGTSRGQNLGVGVNVNVGVGILKAFFSSPAMKQ